MSSGIEGEGLRRAAAPLKKHHRCSLRAISSTTRGVTSRPQKERLPRGASSWREATAERSADESGCCAPGCPVLRSGAWVRARRAATRTATTGNVKSGESAVARSRDDGQRRWRRRLRLRHWRRDGQDGEGRGERRGRTKARAGERESDERSEDGGETEGRRREKKEVGERGEERGAERRRARRLEFQRGRKGRAGGGGRALRRTAAPLGEDASKMPRKWTLRTRDDVSPGLPLSVCSRAYFFSDTSSVSRDRSERETVRFVTRRATH